RADRVSQGRSPCPGANERGRRSAGVLLRRRSSTCTRAFPMSLFRFLRSTKSGRPALTPKQARPHLGLESLEDRSVPATLVLNQFGGVYYSASAGDPNNLSVSVSNGPSPFRDSTASIQGIDLLQNGAMRIVDAHTITIAESAFTGISVDLGD